MLIELRIANLALAEDVVLRPGPGLTVLTGETGAGKSLIAGALALLTGQKSSRQLVRSGEDEGWVEAVVDVSGRPDLQSDLKRLGVVPDRDGILVLRREIRREGRGRVLIDGRQSSIGVLAGLGRRLFSIQSQDQRRELAAADFAREWLDDVLDLGSERRDVADAFERERDCSVRLERREQQDALATEQLDLWSYQYRELTTADLREDEEDELRGAIATKRHAHAMLEAAGVARQRLDAGPTPARQELGAAIAALQPHVEHHVRLASACEQLNTAVELVSDAASDLERFLDGFAADPRGLDEIEARKALYEELRRKYDRDLQGLLALRDDLDTRIRQQHDGAGDLTRLRDELLEAQRGLEEACRALHARRLDGALRAAAAAEATIRPLALRQLCLEIVVDLQTDADGTVDIGGERCRVSAHGSDSVTFMIRTNPGEEPGAVADIASGGEAARIHLGLTVLRQRASRPLVWLFDEVDAGLGMDSATTVALLLRELAQDGQAICITHLPTVAVHGAQHWRVEKVVDAGRTHLELCELNAVDRIDEVARQLGGEGWRRDDTAAQATYARELLAAAGNS